jgi:geranylgeranyl diphosphate synthase type II
MVRVTDRDTVKEYEELLISERVSIENRMDEILPGPEERPVSLHEAMRYSSLKGGKRIRGIFCIEGHKLFGNPHPQSALDAACAIEFLHAYTLIHDDLPAIDNDEMRRGRPSCHVRFGEAHAILAGDALQALSFETLAGCSAPSVNVLHALQILSRTAGSMFLVGGQVADIEGEGSNPAPGDVEYIHSRKTAELISASLGIGAALAGAGEGDVEMLRNVGRDVGISFQIVDDILDMEGSEESMGKGLRKDLKKGKITWPACHGMAASKQLARDLVERSVEMIRKIDDNGFLEYMFRLVVERAS